MTNFFVLDTCVLVDDYNSIYSYGEEEIVVFTTTVVSELDEHKKRSDDVGRNSREVIRILDKFCAISGDLSKGIKIKDGPTIMTYIDEVGLCPKKVLLQKPINNDERIIQSALKIKLENPNSNVYLISQDGGMRIKARMYGIESMSYDNPNKISKKTEEFYSGVTEIVLTSEEIDEFYQFKQLYYDKEVLYPNQFVVMKAMMDSEKVHVADGIVSENNIIKQYKPIKRAYELEAANQEQIYALTLLMNTKISFVTMLGSAGTGKTLLAISSALQQIKSGKYDRLVITKPMIPVGKELGFLPGTKQEKIDPWMGSIYDNLRCLMTDAEIDDLIDDKIIEFEALSFFRGRSLPNSIIFIDEAQNINKMEAKTLLTRAGSGSKVVMTACISQIDNNYVDCVTNGASHCVERLKEEVCTGHITLIKGERSELANIAEEKL